MPLDQVIHRALQREVRFDHVIAGTLSFPVQAVPVNAFLGACQHAQDGVHVLFGPILQEIHGHGGERQTLRRVACDERAGTPIGGNDLIIAAQAVSLGLTVVTGNVREFSRVEDLGVMMWD